VLSKDIPETTIDVDVNQVNFIFNLEQEQSAKDIDFDVSENEIKLKSNYYEYSKKFTDFRMNPQ